jgi:hypothetical protein
VFFFSDELCLLVLVDYSNRAVGHMKPEFCLVVQEFKRTNLTFCVSLGATIKLGRPSAGACENGC